MIYEKIRDAVDEPLVFYTDHVQICEHHHASIEVAHILSGKARLSIDGNEYTLTEREFAVVGSNLIHSYSEQEGLCMVVLLPLVSLAPFRSTLLGCTFSPCVFSDTSDGFVRILFDTMKKLTNGHLDFFDQTNKAALMQSLSEAFMTFVFGRTTFVKKTDRSLADSVVIHDYLLLNYTSEISISSLAKHFGYTEKHITDIIKCLCGMSLKEYVYMLRIGEAKRLLLDELTLEEISVRLGFSCTRTFLRAFVKITGMTPSTYKASCHDDTSRLMLPNNDLYLH